MAAVLISFLVSGRWAWIVGMVVGIGAAIAGIATKMGIVIGGGAAIFALCLVFLILSLVTGGQSD
jgi:hypothetical protein